MKHIRVIPHLKGRIEVRATEHRDQSVFYYYGYLHSGKSVGYSKSLETIKRRLMQGAVKK